MERELIQGTEEWLNVRKQHIGSSDAAAIMSASPWHTPYSLWQEKLGLRLPKKMNDAMRRGRDMEPRAREEFMEMTDLPVAPSVLFSNTKTWMMASLDGITPDKSVAVEIKCAGRDDHNEALLGKIPDKYFPQLQHQIYVAELDFIYYFSFDGNQGTILEVERDDKYIGKLLTAEEEFWNCLQDLEPPKTTDRDFRNMESNEKWLQAKAGYQRAVHQRTIAEAEIELWKNELILLSEGENSIGGGVRLSRVMKKGNINYKSIPDLKEIDLEKYRGNPSEYWRITLDGH